MAVKALKIVALEELEADPLLQQPFLLLDCWRDPLAIVEDTAFIAGNGVLQPAGILLNSDVATVDVEGSANNIAAGSGAKLVDLLTALPEQYVQPRWIMRRAIETELRKLTADAATPNVAFLFPFSEGRAPDGSRLLAGYPVDHSSAMDDDGTVGNRVLVFGDLGAGYTVASRSLLSVELRERFADEGRIGLILHSRVGGAVSNPDAVRIGIV